MVKRSAPSGESETSTSGQGAATAGPRVDPKLKAQVRKEVAEKLQKYKRGERASAKGVTDKKLKGKITRSEKQFQDAAYKAARAEILLPDQPGLLEAEGMEKTYRLSQHELVKEVDAQSAQKRLDLQLEFGPYSIDFSRNGRNMLLGGRKGHVALMNWSTCYLMAELQLKETVRDVKLLHNETMFAVAQKKYVHIYDQTGTEIHCLRSHIDVTKLDFLPYHFLMTTVGAAGYLKYQDTSTGQLVAEHRTKMGGCDVMRQNPKNAVVVLGHVNGQASMWTPNMSSPVVKMWTHQGSVLDAVVDPSGNYMVTSGVDRQIKVWDIRTYKPVHAYLSATPATSLDISQMGLLAVTFGTNVEMWRNALDVKQNAPYMAHRMPGQKGQKVRFCPFEDVLGVGHSAGVSTLLVPGAGQPNFDSFEANPFETKKQRREHEIVSLLDKVRPEMITLETTMIGTIEQDQEQNLKERRAAMEEANASKKKKKKRHMRGKDKIAKRLGKKAFNIVEDKKKDIRQELKERQEEERQKKVDNEEKHGALSRFYNK